MKKHVKVIRDFAKTIVSQKQEVLKHHTPHKNEKKDFLGTNVNGPNLWRPLK